MIRFRPAAARELAADVRYYDERHPGRGQRFAQAVEISLAVIASFPLAYPVLYEPDIRSAKVPRFPAGCIADQRAGLRQRLATGVSALSAGVPPATHRIHSQVHRNGPPHPHCQANLVANRGCTRRGRLPHSGTRRACQQSNRNTGRRADRQAGRAQRSAQLYRSGSSPLLRYSCLQGESAVARPAGG